MAGTLPPFKIESPPELRKKTQHRQEELTVNRFQVVRKTFFATAFVACNIAAHGAYAEQSTQIAAAQIVVSGSAEVLVPPTKASFSIGVLTSAKAAATAAEDNARISKTVLEALERAGLSHIEITGTRFGVRPKWEYDDSGRHPKRTAFEATNTIQIVTENLAQVGLLLDAALSAGATDVSDVNFAAKDIDEARRRALGQAVAAARADAEAMARAGGGALGDLLLLTTEKINDSSGGDLDEVIVTGTRRSRQSPVNTEVLPSDIKVSARIIARWKFVVPAGPK
jgi:uncharacterized protein YggE